MKNASQIVTNILGCVCWIFDREYTSSWCAQRQHPRAGCVARQHLGTWSCVSGAESNTLSLARSRRSLASARPKASHTIASIAISVGLMARLQAWRGGACGAGLPRKRLRAPWGYQPPDAGAGVRERRHWGRMRGGGFAVHEAVVGPRTTDFCRVDFGIFDGWAQAATRRSS